MLRNSSPPVCLHSAFTRMQQTVDKDSLIFVTSGEFQERIVFSPHLSEATSTGDVQSMNVGVAVFGRYDFAGEFPFVYRYLPTYLPLKWTICILRFLHFLVFLRIWARQHPFCCQLCCRTTASTPCC
jgi:hypothetical protein